MLDQHQRYEGTGGERVYRNRAMAGVAGLFSLIALGVLLSDALSRSNPLWFKLVGLGLVVVFAIYIARAMLVDVRVTPEQIRIRNILTTRTIPWAEIAAVEALRANGSTFSPACSVVFRLSDGRQLRAQALRRSSSDASDIAADLAAQYLHK
jgi:Bacterial PH domain